MLKVIFEFLNEMIFIINEAIYSMQKYDRLGFKSVKISFMVILIIKYSKMTNPIHKKIPAVRGI